MATNEELLALLKEADTAGLYHSEEGDRCIYCGGDVFIKQSYADSERGTWGDLISEKHHSGCFVLRIREAVNGS